AAGVAAIAFGVYLTYKAFKKSKVLDEQTKAAAGTYRVPDIEPLPKDQLTEYYVAHDGVMLKPGYKMDDKDRNLVFEAPMTKQALVGDRTFTFTNHLTGETKEHQVGHTLTSTYNDEFLSQRSTLKFDGQDIWDLLHARGVRIAADIVSKFPNVTYHVAVNGKFFATIQTCGQWVHEDDAAQHSVNIPMGRYYYRVWTNSDDMDTLFLTVFALSETEQVLAE
ncbi:MAG: hypothetical protein K6C12_03560, partial [Oscillospiraceae bacterium]|nr:hypothetical protein [Oscillospiraceae bacterium]